MKRWYNRKPETMQDWLLLFAVAAALLAAVWYLPAIAAALRVLLGLATPFAGGLALAYVLDIPAAGLPSTCSEGGAGGYPAGVSGTFWHSCGTGGAGCTAAGAKRGQLCRGSARLPGKRAGVAGAGAGKLWGGYHQPE